MPIYEYRCPNAHTFEMFQPMTDPPPEACPTCGAGPLEKVLFPVAVHFKGSGFYSTDYGKGGRKASRDGDSSSSSGGDSSSSSSDSKPAETKKDSGSTEKKATAAD